MPIPIRLALRELQKHPPRTGLTILAVGLGVSSLVASEGISSAIRSQLSGDEQVEVVTLFISEQLKVGLDAIGMVLLVASGFLLFNTFLTTLSQRALLIGRLRSVGMSRRQVFIWVLLEASLIGIGGITLARIFGPSLARTLTLALETFSPMLNAFEEVSVSTGGWILSVTIGLGISWLAAIYPALQSTRVPPLTAIRAVQSGGIQPSKPSASLVGFVGLSLLTLVLAFYPPANWRMEGIGHLPLYLSMSIFIISAVLLLPASLTLTARLTRRLSAGRLEFHLGMRNLLRDPGRVVPTVLSIATAVAMVVGMTGFITFWFDELFSVTMEGSARSGSVGVWPLDIRTGLQAYGDVEQMFIPESVVDTVEEEFGDRLDVLRVRFILEPNLSFMGSNYFSILVPMEDLTNSGDILYSMEAEERNRLTSSTPGACQLLLSPMVAYRQGVGTEDPLTISSPFGQLECTVVGVGPSMVGASIITGISKSALQSVPPTALLLLPGDGLDSKTLETAMQALLKGYPGIYVYNIQELIEAQFEVMESVRWMMNGMLLLSVLVAVIGIINITLIQINQRRQEFFLLHAVGATRTQMRWLILFEAGFLSAFGSLYGVFLGLGACATYILSTGAKELGLPQFDVWLALAHSLPPGALNGAVGLIVVPLVSFAAALLAFKSFSPPSSVPGEL